jgi:hypothetical protein
MKTWLPSATLHSIAIWDLLAEVSKERRNNNISIGKAEKPATKVALQQRADYLRELLLDKFVALLPYERPKLAMIKYEGGRGDRTIDLTRLPDDRLKQLKEITLLLTGATGPGGVDADDDPPGGAAASRRARAAEDRKGLRKAPRRAGRPG